MRKYRFTQDNKDLAVMDLPLSAADLAELDADTVPPKVYPNWFIEQLADTQVAKALA